MVQPQRGLNNLYGCPLVCDEGLTVKWRASHVDCVDVVLRGQFNVWAFGFWTPRSQHWLSLLPFLGRRNEHQLSSTKYGRPSNSLQVDLRTDHVSWSGLKFSNHFALFIFHIISPATLHNNSIGVLGKRHYGRLGYNWKVAAFWAPLNRLLGNLAQLNYVETSKETPVDQSWGRSVHGRL